MSAEKNNALQDLPVKKGNKEKILEIVEKVNLSEMSSIKSSVAAIIRVINDPQSTVKELTEVIQLDPPLTARVLKTANSAYYSRSYTRSYTDIEQAIIWMGSEIIKELALSQKVCEIFDKEDVIEEYSRKALWKHSVAVALMAKMIYRKEFGLRGENAYVAGLLHDIGIIAEDQFIQEDFKRILKLTREKKVCVSKAEQEIWGYDHADIGAAITFSWGLPEELTSTICYHTNPLALRGRYKRIVATLYAADYICQNCGFAFNAFPLPSQNIFEKCLDMTEIKSHAIDMIFKSVKEEIAKMEDKGLL